MSLNKLSLVTSVALLAGSSLAISGFADDSSFSESSSSSSCSSSSSSSSSDNQDGGSAAGASGSSSSSIYMKGVGFKDSNGFAPKYRERLDNFSERIETGLAKGWLSTDTSVSLKKEVARLATLEAGLKARGYPKADTDAFEKQMNTFNITFTQASSKAGSTPAPPVEAAPGTTPAKPLSTTSQPAQAPAAKSVSTDAAAKPAGAQPGANSKKRL